MDEFARFDADVYLYNVRTVYADNGAFVPGWSAHLTIPGAGENPPCCLVIEGNARSTEITVLHGEEWFIRSYAGRPGSVNFNQWEQDRCRVTATGPTGSPPKKPELLVLYDNGGLNHLVCIGGWENF